VVQDHARERGRQHQDHQPRQPGLPGGKNAGFQIGLVRRQHSGHLLKVLRGLLLDNVHGVVHGDNAHQALLLVHHRHGQEVVLAQGLGHVLFIIHGVHGHHIGVHDLLDQVVLLRQQQIPDGQHTQQMPGRIGDIQDVDGLQLTADTADALEGVLHRHVLFQGQKLHVHNGSGGVLRVLEDLVDGLAHFRRGLVQDADHHAGGHFLHDVHGIVQIQLVQHLLQLGVGKAVDEHLLAVGLQLHEYLRRQLLGQQPVQQRHLFPAGLLQQQGDIRRLHRQEQVPQSGVLLIFDKLLDFLQIFVQFFLMIEHDRFLLP